jgi:hypothetical protein
LKGPQLTAKKGVERGAGEIAGFNCEERLRLLSTTSDSRGRIRHGR